jgi:hypothetical protein
MRFSKDWREANRLPTLEHEEFFEFLLISPSYQLATSIKIGAVKMPSDTDRPLDFDKVLKLYDLVGNISEVIFDQWWVSTGQYIFFDSNKSKEINITIDITKDKETLLNEISQLIENEKQKPDTSKKIHFITNKVRVKTLSSRINLVHDFANKRTKFPTIEYWRVAVFTGLKSQYINGLKIDSKKTPGNIIAREKLTELVTKHLKDALYFSENAARGDFPLNAPIETGLEFNLQLIREIGFRQGKIESQYRYALKEKRGQRLNDSQRSKFMKRTRKKLK